MWTAIDTRLVVTAVLVIVIITSRAPWHAFPPLLVLLASPVL